MSYAFSSFFHVFILAYLKRKARNRKRSHTAAVSNKQKRCNMRKRTALTGPPSVYILYQDYNLCLCFASKCVTIKQVRGISAAGSVFDWQSRGQGFDPPMLHHINPVIVTVTGFHFFLGDIWATFLHCH